MVFSKGHKTLAIIVIIKQTNVELKLDVRLPKFLPFVHQQRRILFNRTSQWFANLAAQENYQANTKVWVEAEKLLE